MNKHFFKTLLICLCFLGCASKSKDAKATTKENELVDYFADNGFGMTKNELKNNEVQIVPIKGLPILTRWNIIWLKSKKLSPTALAFLEYLNAEKDQVIKETFDWIERY